MASITFQQRSIYHASCEWVRSHPEKWRGFIPVELMRRSGAKSPSVVSHAIEIAGGVTAGVIVIAVVVILVLVRIHTKKMRAVRAQFMDDCDGVPRIHVSGPVQAILDSLAKVESTTVLPADKEMVRQVMQELCSGGLFAYVSIPSFHPDKFMWNPNHRIVNHGKPSNLFFLFFFFLFLFFFGMIQNRH
jgi:hypothetical protein